MKEIQESRLDRQGGVLLSVTSLPSPYGIGDFGPELLRFIDKLQESGIRLLSLLPMNPIGFGNSPYQSHSANAWNIYLISPQALYEEGLLTREDLDAAKEPKSSTVDYGRLFKTRPPMLRKAFRAFVKKGGLNREDYQTFCAAYSGWLDGFAAYMTVKAAMDYQPWWMWPAELARRQEPAYSQWLSRESENLELWRFTQFAFFSQWKRVKAYANAKGIEIIGDMPFYVAADSADVWLHPELFAVNPESGKTELWAGVPADNFSSSDRSWGNPTYNWKNHKADDYQWFRQRIRTCRRIYDALRIDHVIGMKRYFGIKEGQTVGIWYDGPEMEDHSFSDAICEEAGGMPIIAEDLGKVPDGLRERMHEIGWAGMRVLEFAFTGKYMAKSNHLPFCHRQDMVVYTGTHDTPTLKEFLDKKTDQELRYMSWWTHMYTREGLHGALLEEAYKSPANRVIIPLQDLLGLGGEARMVFTDDYERSWKWRLPSLDAFDSGVCRRFKRLAVLTGRCTVKDEAEFEQYLELENRKG